jgi:hypothetical protein
MTIVSDGRRATIYTPESGLVEHESETLRPTVDHLVDPSVLIPSLEFEVAGEAELAGRRALVVGASPRPPRLPPIELVPYGCREVTLHVDQETGVLLRIEARLDSRPVQLLEVSEITFDAPLAESVFAFPAGPARLAADVYASRTVTLMEAATDAGFVVWAPTRLPGRWRTHVVHRPRSERPRLPETVMLLISDSESLHHFGIEQAAVELLAWRVGNDRIVQIEGQELRLVGGNQLPGPPLEVHLERGGTHIRVWSDNLDEGSLIDVATSLAPASTELPPTRE